MIEDQELNKLKRLWSRIDTSDKEKVRKWFESYPYFSITDHAIIMERCTARVRELRASCGLKGRGPTTTKRTKQIPLNLGNIPDNWRTKEWLEPNIKTHGIHVIARSVGVSEVTIRKLMDRYGIKGRGRKSNNPCCTQAWCHKHYVDLQLSAPQCAKLAGITRARFADWLVKFKIPARPIHVKQDCNIQLKFHFKVLINKLMADPNVKEVRIHKSHLCIKHQDNLYSRYIFSKMAQEDWKFDKAPPIINQYDNDFVSKETAHIAINRKQLNKCSLLERDVALHRFNRIINTRGWIWPEYPLEELKKDLNRLRREKEANYIKDGAFTLLHNNCPGRRILTNYFDSSQVYNQVLRKPFITYRILYKLYRSKNNDFDFYNVMRMVTRSNFKNYKFKLPNPTFYAVILRRLKITGRVLDLNVGSGSHALACAINGLHYMHLNDARFNKAIELGFADFIKLNHSIYEGNVDLVIADKDLTGDDCEQCIIEAFKYADVTKRIVAYVPRELKGDLYSKYKPQSMIKLITHPVNREPNYLFIW